MSSILKPLQLDEPQTKSTNLARSRRKSVPKTVPTVEQPRFRRQISELTPNHEGQLFEALQTALAKINWKEYLLHLPLLISALLAYGGIIFIFGWIEPRSIQNVLLPNSYAPLLLVSVVANFCLFSYFFLNSRRGVIVSLALTILLFLRLQQVLTIPITIWVVIIGVAIEVAYLVLRFFYRKMAHTLSLPSLPKFRRRQTEEFNPTPPQTFPSQTVDLSPRQRKHGRKRKHHFFGK